jgi:hypothetical protein
MLIEDTEIFKKLKKEDLDRIKSIKTQGVFIDEKAIIKLGEKENA